MTAIAVLGWGSLVWQPRNDHGEILLDGGWHADGPLLPVEFARISSDGRLTLILLPGYPHRSPVMWARSACDDLGAARANLARRETSAPLASAHAVTSAGEVFGDPDPEVVGAVSEWLGDAALDAVAWTGLGPGKRWGGVGFTPEGAVAHLLGLTGEQRARAEEYVLRAPPQIDTPVRRLLAEASGDATAPPRDEEAPAEREGFEPSRGL